MILRNPQMLLLLLALPLGYLLWRWRGGRVTRLTLALRLLIVGLLVLALADPVLGRPSTGAGTQVLLVDQSDSLSERGKAALREQAARLSAGSTARVLFFGANASPPPGTDGQTPQELRTDATDIAAALRAAGELIGTANGRVLLLSDGGQTRGDALAEARVLQARGIAVDTYAYNPPGQADVWVTRVEAPRTLRQGEDYSVGVTIGSTSEGRVRLELFDGNRLLEAREVPVTPGEQTVEPFRARAASPGVARLRAVITAEPDAFPQNNSAAATAIVAPPPRVLVVEGSSGGAAPLRVGLREAGIETDVIDAGRLPAQLARLDAYEGVVLVNVPAGDLSLDQMTTLREFVRSEGRGLVVTGGRSSFTLGAYKDTPLEQALPVEMTPPPRPERSEVTMLLILDQSASMGASSGASKLDMAKEAAILATQSLRDEDRVGLLAFDTQQQWVVPFQQLGTGLSLGQIQEQIGQIGLGGGTDIYGALAASLPELARQPGQVRHAVLLTDGRSFSSAREPYRALLAQARALNITLSTIAIGEDSDTELLKELAQEGAGRYHFAADPEDIPRLTLQESEIARTEPQVEAQFRAQQPAPHPLLREIGAAQIPELDGYVATTLKPEADLVLESPDTDPVLASWQYGLGRAVAWTPSVEAPWAESWERWPQYSEFWAQIVRYTLPEPDSGPLQVRVTPRAGETLISVDSLLPGGAALDLADTRATLTLPDGGSRVVELRQTGPGSYAASVRLPTDGPYTISVEQRKDAQQRNAEIGYVQPYPAEYLPVSGGAELLAEISAAAGGTALAQLPDAALAGEVGGGSAPISLAPWLLLVAALLWPVEVAARRGWLRL
ncbi:MAG: VWA domain-containing protein [Roseiflexaceae bacterium]